MKNVEKKENKLKVFWDKHKKKIIFVGTGVIVGGAATYIGYKYGYNVAAKMCKEGQKNIDTVLQQVVDSYEVDPHTGRSFATDLTAFLAPMNKTDFVIPRGAARATEAVFTKEFIDTWQYPPEENMLVRGVAVGFVNAET